MDDLTASILILLTVSPAIAVLIALIARWVRGIWKGCAHSAQAKLQEAVGDKVAFHGKLCGKTS